MSTRKTANGWNVNRRDLLKIIGVGGIGASLFAWNTVSPNQDSVEASAIGSGTTSGGGFTRSGITGEYFANTSLSGDPAFTRHDVRIDFDWDQSAPIGSLSHTGIGTDHFSIRWTGQIIPRFSETYTFITTTDDGVRLFIKQAGTGTWTTVIDQWIAQPATDHSGQHALTAGQLYDISMEYYEASGHAVAKLAWESPSTPRQIIEPVRLVLANMDTLGDSDPAQSLADVFHANRGPMPLDGQPGPIPVDEHGWPQRDFKYIWWDGAFARYPDISGTYRLSFHGQADLALSLVNGRIENKVYDAATNTTTADIVITQVENTSPYLHFTHTQRTSSSGTNTGLTNIKLMRPIAPGSSTTYPTSALFTTVFITMASHFAILRQMGNTGANGGTELNGNWSTRRLPTYASLTGVFDPNRTVAPGVAWEFAIQFWNQTGRDAYVNVPFPADDTSIRNLALLLKYGSDGVNPYTSRQTNPVYPPLNSNLKIYVEYSNELWNYFGSFPAPDNEAAAIAEATNDPNSPLNYDAIFDPATTNGKYEIARRRAIKRGKEVSVIFREVFGNEAMMTRVRPVFMWQYDDLNATASDALEFLDDYYNNGDGIQHVTDPHPVNYYFWGGGGATYYGAKNNTAATVDELYNSGIPAEGYGSVQLRGQNLWAKLYGLEYVSYEGGWSVETNCGNGGYGCVSEVTKAAKIDSRAKQAHLDAEQIFHEEGGTINSVLIPVGDERSPWSMTYSVYSLDVPLWQAHKQLIDTLPEEPTTGVLVDPSGTTTFNVFDGSYVDLNVGGIRSKQHGATFNNGEEFRGAVFRVAANGSYTFAVSVQNAGAGGQLRFSVDGDLVKTVDVPQSGSAQTVVVGSVALHKGQHAFMVQPYANASSGSDKAGILHNVTISRS